jgi:hypothetical protein
MLLALFYHSLRALRTRLRTRLRPLLVILRLRLLRRIRLWFEPRTNDCALAVLSV